MQVSRNWGQPAGPAPIRQYMRRFGRPDGFAVSSAYVREPADPGWHKRLLWGIPTLSAIPAEIERAFRAKWVHFALKRSIADCR